jgi:hypothetical protein
MPYVTDNAIWRELPGYIADGLDLSIIDHHFVLGTRIGRIEYCKIKFLTWVQTAVHPYMYIRDGYIEIPYSQWDKLSGKVFQLASRWEQEKKEPIHIIKGAPGRLYP